MNIFLMTFPINIISSIENLSPRAKLHASHAGTTFPLIWGRLLSILSNPLFLSKVPQYVHGNCITSTSSSVEKSQESIFLYAPLKKQALPLIVFAYRLAKKVLLSLCSIVMDAHRSLLSLLSVPTFLMEWHFRQSYVIPNNLLLSPTKNSLVAGNSILQRLQIRLSGCDDFLCFPMSKTISGEEKFINKDLVHFELDRRKYP